MEISEAFKSVRDIPYRIPLRWNEEDNCCSGKHEKLMKILQKNGYDARYRVCIFLWNSMKILRKILNIPHDDDCTHTYIEVKSSGAWKALDATWDRKLRGTFKINEWDGKSSTKLAVKPIRIFSPRKSLEIVKGQTKKVIEDDLIRNKKFYKALNEWLEMNRYSH